MPDYRQLNKELVSGLKQSIPYANIRLGYMGKISATDTINPDPTDGLEQGYAWVRFDNNGEAIRARCHKISARMPDMPVRVGQDVMSGEWTILEIVPVDLGQINALASTFSVPDRNPDWIYEEFDANRFINLHVIPGAVAFDVEVEPGLYWYHGTLKAWAGGTINIASSVPTGGFGGSKRGVLIGIDPATDTLTTHDGEKIGIAVTPGNEGKYFTETYIADTVNDASTAVYWVALIPLTSQDTNWGSLYRVTALQLTGSLGAALTGHGVRVNDVDQTQRGFINFIQGNGITLAGVDDSANDETEISVTVNQGQLSLGNLGTRLLDNLSDVVITTPSTFEVLRYDGANWVNDLMTEGHTIQNSIGTLFNPRGKLQFVDTPLALGVSWTLLDDSANDRTRVFATVTANLDALSDVTLSSPAADDVLFYTGSVWGNGKINVLKTGDTMTGALVMSQTATTGTVASSLTVNSAAHTALTASTERSEINLNFSATQQWATGALTTQRFLRVQAPTIGFVGSSTVTNAVTVDIAGAPIAGTNATLTNRIALRVGDRLQITGTLDIVPPASTGSPLNGILFTAPAHTGLTAATEYTDINLNLSRTVQFTTGGTIGTQRAIRIQAPTYSATSATQTITDAYTVEIAGPPVAGTNVSITNARTLRVANGVTRLDGQLQMNNLVVMGEGNNFQFGGTTGTKIGTGSTQKIGFWDATPVVRSNSWSITNPVSRKAFDTTTVTLQQLAESVGTIIDTMKTYGLLGA